MQALVPMSTNGDAKGLHKPSLKGRADSKFVAIPKISLGRKLEAPVSAQPSSTLVEHPTPTPPVVSSATSSKTSGISEQVQWEYDVYAKPFVPSQLQAINLEEAGSIISTRSRHRIDYPAYTATFAGTSFLPERPTQAPDVKSESTSSLDLTPRTYCHDITALWELECAAKVQQIGENAMYKVHLVSFQRSNREPLWTLSVPGLRDDDPYLEKGDVLQLRQLWVDHVQNVFQVPMSLEDPHNGQIRWEYKSWTGVQHDAYISGVNRKKETVYLEAEGLAPLHANGISFPMMVNVIVPMKHASLEAQRMALVKVSIELAKTLPSGPEADADDFDEFDPTVKPQHKSNNTSQEFCNDWIHRILFPDQEHGLQQTQLRKVPHRNLFDSAVNYEQAHAVNSVCINDYGTLPYLISGPPGTGKTKTLVEIAMNLLNTTDVAHILICAPSEAAADTLALRLSTYLDRKQLLRLNRSKRADNEVIRDLLPFCYMENDMFYLPPFKALMAYNIVVTSCQDAAILADARLTNNDLWKLEKNMASAFRPEEQAPTPKLHWGALLIDEAAQATEIDVLPAISVVCPPSKYPTSLAQPLFVMAGDENQLGPRTASRDPRFSTSLFSRLFERPVYKIHPLSRTNTKPSIGPPVLKKSMLPINYPPFANLIRNYRSHPAILSVPSSIFYNDTLIPEAPALISPLQQSTLWRGRKWPVLFLPHKANDEIERDGGGWYNLSEAKLACSIAQTLVYKSKVRQADICIMSAFAAQVKLLRSLMQSKAYGGGSGLWDVNIGPLEAFQGLEKRVVIISTTRTRSRFLETDAKKGVGIVGQKRKMNVALTRAKEALFVIGNPEVLGQDEHWRQWLAFCWRNGLVEDPGKIWDGGKDAFGEEKIGVLERTLIAKEENGKRGRGKMLGAAVTSLDMTRDYETWVESLREALDEESEEEGEDEGTGEEDEEDATEEGDGSSTEE